MFQGRAGAPKPGQFWLLLSPGQAVGNLWAAGHVLMDALGSLCPFCACKAQRGWQVPGVAVASARTGSDPPPQTGTRVPPAQPPPLSSPRPPFPAHAAPLSRLILLVVIYFPRRNTKPPEPGLANYRSPGNENSRAALIGRLFN